MSSLVHNHISKTKCLEDLPDEIVLLICRYLSQVNILDSFLNLNSRLNKAITRYREKIFLSHLSYHDFHRLIKKHLPRLATNVYSLYINNCAMLNAGKKFESQFNKIDQQFPLLCDLSFHQIDIETLENLSWRFNTMKSLRYLDIDISGDRLLSMPMAFDEFLCGKLFSHSNTFVSLRLNFNDYYFSLHSIQHKCENIRHLSMSVKRLDDLLILFNYFPSIEKLNIAISCSSIYNNIDNDIYSYEHLWWKVPCLTDFNLTIEEKELSSHNNIIPNNIIIKIVENIYSLLYFKFTLNIRFTSRLQLLTTNDDYVNMYFPYANGTLWQQALQRNDNRSIRFELYIELDGIANDCSRGMVDSDLLITEKINGKFLHFSFLMYHDIFIFVLCFDE